MDARVRTPPYVDIGRRLEIALKLMGFEKAREFCERFNLNESTVSMWIRGKSRINLDDGLRICEESGLTLDYLYRGITGGLPFALVQKIAELSRNSQAA